MTKNILEVLCVVARHALLYQLQQRESGRGRRRKVTACVRRAWSPPLSPPLALHESDRYEAPIALLYPPLYSLQVFLSHLLIIGKWQSRPSQHYMFNPMSSCWWGVCQVDAHMINMKKVWWLFYFQHFYIPHLPISHQPWPNVTLTLHNSPQYSDISHNTTHLQHSP